ncbi:MAG: 16S rRNA (guanine(527)-N(7))-methyltransferase RsmG [Clostridia bacterium]|nr:16S rRNA (guanine(527)-N(7))-methyltransferase RsmG [Clostridia bacterium]
MSELNFSNFSALYLESATAKVRGFENNMDKFTSSATVRRLYCIADRLIDNAKRFNLTSILDPAEIVRKHIIDSLQPIGILADLGYEPLSLLDVGTGAGFPLLPMAAAYADRADCSFTGLDATRKKISHIREVADYAEIANVRGVEGRAEELARGDMREKYTIVTARAVAALPQLIELCAPFVAPGGIFASMKAHAEEEIAASAMGYEKLGLEKTDVIDYELPGGDARSLIIYRKIKSTPQKYPRRYTEILKQPLK